MATGERYIFADMQNPLFLHPSDGHLFIDVQKLEGSSDYKSGRGLLKKVVFCEW